MSESFIHQEEQEQEQEKGIDILEKKESKWKLFLKALNKRYLVSKTWYQKRKQIQNLVENWIRVNPKKIKRF